MNGIHRDIPAVEIGNTSGDDMAPDEIRVALAHILASPTFAKAPRMCRLLRTLVEKTLSGTWREINEFSIGVEVFGRDENTYSTGEDSLVRVQMGRLRERLNVYYAGPGQGATLTISIPLGSYVPRFRRNQAAAAQDSAPAALLLVAPFTGIGPGERCITFAQGFNEELQFHLLSLLGGALAVPGAPAQYRLEGSLRMEPARVRVAARLVDTNAKCIDWHAQFDRPGKLDITLQEDIASAVCSGLRNLSATAMPKVISCFSPFFDSGTRTA